MTTSKAPNSVCWCCGGVHQLATNVVGKAKPRPGDVTLCVSCAAPGIFTDDMGIRRPTERELDLMVNSPVFGSVLMALLQAKGR